MKKKHSQKQIIRTVTAIRRRNNRSWMALLLLALEENPRKARAIVREIIANDKRVTRWMSRV